MRPIAITPYLLVVAMTLPLAADDGEPDFSFGENGLVSWVHWGGGFPPLASEVTVAALATSEELLIAVGWFPDVHLNWSSYNDEGGLAGPGCAQGSSALFSPAITDSRGLAALVDSTGNLLVGGELTVSGSEAQARPFVARFDLGTDGCELDDSFSGNGWAFFDDESFCDTEDCSVVALGEIRPLHGSVPAPRVIALVRSVVIEDAIARYFLLGLTSSGAIDSGFGSQGWREVAPAGLGALSPEVAFEIDARGRINLAVTRYDPDGNFDLDVILVRYSSAGTRDTAIGDGGLVAIADDGPTDGVDSTARSLTLDAKGRAVVGYHQGGSAFVVFDLESEVFYRRIRPSLVAPVVEAQGNGRLLTLHDFASDDGYRAYRWLVPDSLDLSVDSTFGGGFLDYDVDLGGDDAESLVDMTLWHGRPVYLGRTPIDSIPFGALEGAFLLRVDNDYIFADGFDGGGRGRWSDAAP